MMSIRLSSTASQTLLSYDMHGSTDEATAVVRLRLAARKAAAAKHHGPEHEWPKLNGRDTYGTSICHGHINVSVM